ncbi:MAG: hypothetical protein RMK65_08535, partial [Anaerolineae bacterium]|nr:hypothetical protein [Anaerolineae bacterium]
YTYTASRFTPFALMAFALFLLAVRGPAFSVPPAGLGLALAVLVVLLPLALYTLQHPQVRPGPPRPGLHLESRHQWRRPVGTLGRHFLRTLGMFFVRGDCIWRHNVPWRPVFVPLLGAVFLLGVVVSSPLPRRLRRHSLPSPDLPSGEGRGPGGGVRFFPLLWTAVMALPTVLAEDAPHFLRAVGMLPVLAFLPALGLDWLLQPRGHRDTKDNPRIWNLAPLRLGGSRTLGLVVCTLALGMELWSGARAYFGAYARDPMTGYWFERGAVALGADINRFLGVGWSAAASPSMPVAGPEGRAYLDPLLWEDWPQVRFLVAAPERVTVGLEAGGTPCCEAKRMTGILGSLGQQGVPVAVFLWPYGEWTRAWALLPHPAEVTVIEGPLSQHDRDTEPFVTYIAFAAVRPGPVPGRRRLASPEAWNFWGHTSLPWRAALCGSVCAGGPPRRWTGITPSSSTTAGTGRPSGRAMARPLGAAIRRLSGNLATSSTTTTLCPAWGLPSRAGTRSSSASGTPRRESTSPFWTRPGTPPGWRSGCPSPETIGTAENAEMMGEIKN